MGKYIVKRLLLSVVILFFVCFVIYVLMRCLPTSYVEAMAMQLSQQPGSKSYGEWLDRNLVTSSTRSTIWMWASSPATSCSWAR